MAEQEIEMAAEPESAPAEGAPEEVEPALEAAEGDAAQQAAQPEADGAEEQQQVPGLEPDAATDTKVGSQASCAALRHSSAARLVASCLYAL